ncbi:hypothetical protein F1C16_05095 [Hymenobacter sp. NBH84]|uniref:hypothetical protein n=1 Tax=Hymenobacter sp. NBH84 TaxID=2596915 RepID=UPI001624CCF1|nr:hypothetical protein [Hymenobacter sp. NBH84]QNE38972.1 hypothetical protein F1C16_05095 [Hymenobacter sp. NBH84]
MEKQTSRIQEISETQIKKEFDGQILLTEDEIGERYKDYITNLNYWMRNNLPPHYKCKNKYFYPQQVIEEMLGIAQSTPNSPLN